MATKAGQPEKRGKVWKGEKRGGPAPARHIPWPEIFKHHISVVEGHTKMLEMVQKHTVKGTGNYETITNLVKRGHEMIWQAKDISRSFIPPKNQREMVPLGSSSESMYPGYSPAHIEYGKAAGEFGRAVGELKVQGVKWESSTNGPQYEIGQAHGAKRKFLFKEKTENDSNEGALKPASTEPANGDDAKDVEAGETLGFVIDTNPTPVVLPCDLKKRPIEDENEGTEKLHNKKKKSEDKEKKAVVIETEDISAEVEARLKAKKKAKAKDDKKRKRESAGEDQEKVVKKSKRDSTGEDQEKVIKKSKTDSVSEDQEKVVQKSKRGSVDEDQEKLVKKSKRDKSNKREVEDDGEGNGNSKGKKKRKKDKDVE